jgi:hypothetical protein
MVKKEREMSKEKWRDNWESIQIRVPFYEELKAEAEVRGCSIGAVIELYTDAYKHLMLSPGELIRHFRKYHPELVDRVEDLDRDYEEYQADLEFRRKVQEVLEKNQKKMKQSRAIARRKAMEKRRDKAVVVQ